MKNLLVTGGAGFIGSNFVRHILGASPNVRVTVYDKLTYAGNVENLRDIVRNPRYGFVKGDICDEDDVARALRDNSIDTVVNFAAETHVDRSILAPSEFMRTNVLGTHVLLEESRKQGIGRFIQISTDEVYGSIARGAFRETDPLQPNSPYAASKASGELMARAYFVTYGLNTIVTRGSNTFGPFQYPEKLLPLFTTNAIDDQVLPVYGDGTQVRDWLYVDDHCKGIETALKHGVPGEAYNIGGENERHNIEIIHRLLSVLGKPESLIRQVQDRPGHDRRYALDIGKMRSLGWQPREKFEDALESTVKWYSNNEHWWRRIKSSDFWKYYDAQYGERLSRADDRY